MSLNNIWHLSQWSNSSQTVLRSVRLLKRRKLRSQCNLVFLLLLISPKEKTNWNCLHLLYSSLGFWGTTIFCFITCIDQPMADRPSGFRRGTEITVVDQPGFFLWFKIHSFQTIRGILRCFFHADSFSHLSKACKLMRGAKTLYHK